jgi:hypothetical protein
MVFGCTASAAFRVPIIVIVLLEHVDARCRELDEVLDHLPGVRHNLPSFLLLHGSVVRVNGFVDLKRMTACKHVGSQATVAPWEGKHLPSPVPSLPRRRCPFSIHPLVRLVVPQPPSDKQHARPPTMHKMTIAYNTLAALQYHSANCMSKIPA